jgi:hypothetical protein
MFFQVRLRGARGASETDLPMAIAGDIVPLFDFTIWGSEYVFLKHAIC